MDKTKKTVILSKKTNFENQRRKIIMEKDLSDERLGELKIICSLEQEKINSLKEKIALLKEASDYKSDLEKRLTTLEAKQSERKAEFDKLSLEKAISSSSEETSSIQN